MSRGCAVAVVQVEEIVLFKRRWVLMFWPVCARLPVAVLFPIFGEVGATGLRYEGLEIGYCASVPTMSVAEKVGDIAVHCGGRVEKSNLVSERGYELTGGSVPSVKFGDRLEMSKLLINRLEGKPVCGQYPKECPSNTHASGDEGNFVVSHRGRRTWLFALGGGSTGIALGLVIGYLSLRWLLKTPNAELTGTAGLPDGSG